MKNKFVAADLHLGHANIVKFLREDGSKLRPFETIAEHDETIVVNWNNVVGPKDTVYVLGDVVINRRALPHIGRLNGDKVLVKGNHDIFHLHEYAAYFRDIRAYIVGYGAIFSHVPIHPDSLARFKYNVHGHTHSNIVRKFPGNPDPRYVCVSMEHINYTPLSIEQLRKRFTL